MNAPIRTSLDCDVAIIGGGVVGATLALALADAGFDAVLVDAAAPSATPEFDGRAYAISIGCWRMWRVLGLAENLEAAATPIRTIQAEGEAGRAIIVDETDARRGDEPLGYMIENHRLQAALSQAIEASDAVRRVDAAPLRDLQINDNGVIAETAAADIRAQLVVGCDGAKSRVRHSVGIRTYGRRHDARALAAIVQLETPHHGAARQRFLKTGPIAALPLPDDRANIIWSEPAAAASALSALSDDAFERELAHRAGDFIGAFRLVGHRFSYPLALQIADKFTTHRVGLAGDAAHVIHPLAGQGVNLGLKDAAALAETLVDARRVGLDIGAKTALEPYGRWRRADTLAMAGATEGLAYLFEAPAPVRRLAEIGMSLTGRLPWARRLLAAEAGGALGDPPRLLAGERLT